MVNGRKLSVFLVTSSLILAQVGPSALAAGNGQGSEKGKSEQHEPALRGNKPEAKTQSGATTTETTDGCEPAPDEPADGDETLPDESSDITDDTTDDSTDDSADEENTGDETGDDTEDETGDDTEDETGDDSGSCSEGKGNANVNLTGRGKAAEKNPNVDANGQLQPGTAANKSADAEQHIAKTKEESRAKARAERQKGATGAYLVYVNGERLNLTPLSRSGHTLVPFRRLAEFLGAGVEWEPATRTVVMMKDGKTVKIVIGATTAEVDGEQVEMTVPSEIVEGSTFVPVRFIAEALGADVDYDPETGAITVITISDPADDGDENPDENDDGDSDDTADEGAGDSTDGAGDSTDDSTDTSGTGN